MEDPDNTFIAHDQENEQSSSGQVQADLNDCQEKRQKKKKLMIRLLASVTVVAFFLLAFSGSLRLLGLPSLEFLLESHQLSQDDDISKYKAAVLSVHAGDSRGTGFVVADYNLAVTNEHLVEGALRIDIRDTHGRTESYFNWYADPDYDLALIELSDKVVDTLELETGSLPELGDTVLMIGNPLGFFNIVNEAVYLGLTELSGGSVPLIKIQGPVHKGNSGSPLINREGKVIGVLFATSSQPPAEGEHPFGYAIPVAVLSETIQTYQAQD